MVNLHKLTIKQANKMLQNKEVSATELTKEYIKRAKESELNAYITITEEIALEQANRSDKNIARGVAKKLEGIPIGIKDIFCTDGVRTTAASKMLENFIPSYNADVVEKLFDENCVMIGKTNMDEFAMGSTTSNSYFGPSINPLKSKSDPDAKLTPGGSSGGSASAVAGDLCIAALGSDTGGSVRQPAAFCGLVGAKSSYGVSSRYGMLSYASSFDQAGFLGNSVEDVAYLMEVIAGFSAQDSMMYKHKEYDFTSNLNKGVSGMRIAIPKQFSSKDVPESTLKSLEGAIKYFEKNGVTLDFIDLPTIDKSINVYYIITPSEASSNLARFDGIRYGFAPDSKSIKGIDEYYTKVRTEGFGEEVRKRMIIGNYILSSKHYDEYYTKAQKVRRIIKNEFDDAFKNYDAILCPTALNVAFDVTKADENPVTTCLNDICVAPANIAGLPAISVPFGKNHDDLPIGMQIITNRLEDAKMYQIAKALETGGLEF